MLINAEVGYFIANGVYASATELAHIAERSRHNVNGFLPVVSLFYVWGEPTAAAGIKGEREPIRLAGSALRPAA